MKPWFDLERMRVQGMEPNRVKHIIRDRFVDGTYRVPNKGGISYMLAPIHRAYVDPSNNGASGTFSHPHYMPYAPNITGDQLGNYDPTNGGPFALTHGGVDTGPHGYMIFLLSEEKRRALRVEHDSMLAELCELHMNWCLSKDSE